MKNLFFLICASMLLFACEKEIPLDEEESAPRIVINCIFSAGDTIRVQISESRNILYEGTLPNLTDATAELFDENNNSLGTFQHTLDGSYVLPGYQPIAGNSYTIKVKRTGFNDITATTNTPQIIAINSIDTLRKNNTMSYEIKFSDDAAITNYYAIQVSKITYYIDDFTGDTIFYADDYFMTQEIFVQSGSSDINGATWGNIFLFSDASFNGQVCSFTAVHDLNTEDDTVLTVINLSSVSEDYFKYMISYDKYLGTQGSPFAQPVQVYSNVENGFGIFGAYSVYSDTLIIP